ncbi:5491_t:CDS:2, partial [Gigaspora rosea]
AESKKRNLKNHSQNSQNSQNSQTILGSYVSDIINGVRIEKEPTSTDWVASAIGIF